MTMPATLVTIEGGRVRGTRDRQEDAWGFGKIPGGEWAAVADGMGGHRGGDQASGAAVDAIMQHCLDTSAPIDDMAAWMQSGVVAAHRAVEVLAVPHEADSPGTTLLWAVAHGHTVSIAHVGDSRAYLVRGDRVEPLTIDMTPAGQRVRDGRQPWDHQNTAEDSHLLLSSLGQPPLTVELFEVFWQTGDVLILTTDGLNAIPLQHWPALMAVCSVDEILGLAPWMDNATLVVMRHG